MDAEIRKTVLRKIPHGLFVAGVAHEGKVNAFTATWLTQASFHPPMLVMGVRRDSKSFAMIEGGRVFSLNLLGKDQQDIAGEFVKPSQEMSDTLPGAASRTGKTGAPILEDAIAWVECEVREITNPMGDHALVVGEVIDVGQRLDVPALTLMDTGWHYGG